MALMFPHEREKLPRRKRLPKATHMRGQTGMGKSRDELKRMAQSGTERAVMTGLTNSLARQNLGNFKHTFMAPQSAQHYVGNDYDAGDGLIYGCHEDMRIYRAAFGKAGGDVTEVCGMTRDKETGKVHFRCPYGEARQCLISKQLSERAEVLFTSTATLQRPMSGASKPTTQLPAKELSIDETLAPLRRTRKFTVDVITRPFGYTGLGNGMQLSPGEQLAAVEISIRREILGAQDRPPPTEHERLARAGKAGWSVGAFFDVLAIRKITLALQRLHNDPHGGRLYRHDLPRLDEMLRLVDLFSHTLLDRPRRGVDYANPTSSLAHQIANMANRNEPIRRAGLFLSILLELMAMPPLADTIPGVRVIPKVYASPDDNGEVPRVFVGHIMPINPSYHGEEVRWLDATGSGALAQLSHFEVVEQDPPEQPLWDFGEANRLIKLMHRHDGPLSRWTATRLFGEDNKPTPLGWMTLTAIAYLTATFMAEKGVQGRVPHDLLFLTTSEVKDRVRPFVLPGTDIANFKAVNGSNTWAEAHAQAILLSSASTPRNYWEIVEALDGRPRPDPGVWWTPVEHPVLIRSTGEIMTTTINSNPDPLLREYYLEDVTGSFWQGFRLREHRRSDQTLYIVANNEPLPPGIQPDEVVFAEDVGGWYHHIVALFRIAPVVQSNGKFSQNVADVVASLLPERFQSAASVREHARHRRDNINETPQRLAASHGLASAYPVMIRLPGKGSTKWVVEAADRPSARAALDRLSKHLPQGTELKASYTKRASE